MVAHRDSEIHHDTKQTISNEKTAIGRLNK